MSPSRQKHDPFSVAETFLDVHNIFKHSNMDLTLTPPKPNTITEVPFNRLIHHVDYMNNLTECIAVDRGVVELIQRKLQPFVDNNLSRQQVTLNLVDAGDTISVKIWVIPFFLEGVMVYHLFASDDENLNHLRRLRNPAKPGSYDITSF